MAVLKAENKHSELQKLAETITDQDEFQVLRDVVIGWTTQGNTLPRLERISTYKIAEELLRAFLDNNELPLYAKVSNLRIYDNVYVANDLGRLKRGTS